MSIEWQKIASTVYVGRRGNGTTVAIGRRGDVGDRYWIVGDTWRPTLVGAMRRSEKGPAGIPADNRYRLAKID